jgi:hypothetical protein
VRVAVWCVGQLVAEPGETLTEDGLLKTMALSGWNRSPTSVEMGEGLKKYYEDDRFRARARARRGIGPRLRSQQTGQG